MVEIYDAHIPVRQKQLDAKDEVSKDLIYALSLGLGETSCGPPRASK